MRLLLVEDDRLIGRAVAQSLRDAAHVVDWVRDGESALAHLRSGVYDMTVLDLGLPQIDGLEVLREARRRGHDLPVLVLTARDAPVDRVRGLDAGADDYLVKPFDLEELAARVRALGRRRNGRSAPLVTHRGLAVNPATRDVRLAGVSVPLQAREYELLMALLERPGAVLSRDQLREKLYGWDEVTDSNTIEVHVHGLRRKLGADFIRTVRGVGYCVADGE